MVTSPSRRALTDFIQDAPHTDDFAVFNMLVEGEPGVGKTPLVGTIVDVPQMLPALLVDCDSGTLSLRTVKNLKTIHLKQVAAELSEEQKREVTPWNVLEQIRVYLRTQKHDFRTIILDGGSDIESACERDSILFAMEKQREKAHDPELSELADYRRIGERLYRAYCAFRDITTLDGRRMFFIATAHEARKQVNGEVQIQPLFIGKSAVRIASAFDIVARLYTRMGSDGKTPIPCLVAMRTDRVMARDRSKSLGQAIDNPTMAGIYQRIYSAQTNAKG